MVVLPLGVALFFKVLFEANSVARLSAARTEED
jgi:hypothetical protein